MTAIEWEGRDAEADLLPASPQQMQIVVTDGWTLQERHVWIVDRGEDVRSVFRCSANDVDDVVASAMKETSGCVVRPSVSIGQSSYVVRPPPPPPPPGLEAEFSAEYAHDVVEFARAVSMKADKRCTTLVITSLGTGPIPPPPGPGPGGIVAGIGGLTNPPPPPPWPGGIVADPTSD